MRLQATRTNRRKPWWPLDVKACPGVADGMCRRIVEGTCRLLKEECEAYPMILGPPTIRRRPSARKYPEGTEFNCPACKSRLPATDPKHTRNEEPPGACPFPDVGPVHWPCPGCVENWAFNHPSHVPNPTICRAPEPRRHFSKAAGPGPHRDLSAPVAARPEDRNPPSHEPEFVWRVVPSGHTLHSILPDNSSTMRP